MSRGRFLRVFFVFFYGVFVKFWEKLVFNAQFCSERFVDVFVAAIFDMAKDMRGF